MRKKFRFLTHPIEYAAARLGLFLVDHLPLRALDRLATGLADIWYRLAAKRRRIARDNIRRSGIADSPAEIDRIARDSFRNFALMVVESLRAGDVFTPDNWRERVTFDMPQETVDLLEKPGQGVILTSGHMGNWQIAGELLALIKPVVGVARKMNNPYVDRLLKKRQVSDRFRLTPRHDMDVTRFLTALKKGNILALLIDQHANAQPARIDFFGRPAATHRSPALLHLVTGTPIFFGVCIRTGPLRYTLRAVAPVIHKPTGNRDEDVNAILQKLTDELERFVRDDPGQYLWAHRRWRD